MQSLFGTDGIRGRANIHPMTSEVALRVGMAVAHHFRGEGRVVVGKDTRLSGYMFETAVASGLCSVGAEVMLVGPLPTPGIAHIVRSMRADAGIVISASHNPFEDNGIKIFGADGFKLPDAVELELQELVLSSDLVQRLAGPDDIGKAVRIDDAPGRYIAHVKHAFPDALTLEGLRVVVDCAHGAAYRIAPSVFSELGATVIAVGVEPDGKNINLGVGATSPQHLASCVVRHQADLGVALDGDADRVILCDHRGKVVNGDAILAICAREFLSLGTLRGDCVVATVMSNMGLERSLGEIGLRLIRTDVGDRYVVETMRTNGYNLGGEQSGHIICLDHSTTGDGVVASLQVLASMVRSGRSLADLSTVMTDMPQQLRNIAVAKKLPLTELPKLGAAIKHVEGQLGSRGRALVRFSGTEKKLRIMLEGEDRAELTAFMSELENAAIGELGQAETE